MPFEDPKFISDLVITNPTSADLRSAGDQHLRALRLVLIGDGTDQAGSFTSNFTGQYTGTAAELQSVVDQIIPDPLPEDGDLLVWDTDKFVAQEPKNPVIHSGRYYGGVSGPGDTIYFASAVENIPDNSLVEIINASDVSGWRLTAKATIMVNISWQYALAGSGGGSARADGTMGLNTSLNTALASVLEADRVEYSANEGERQASVHVGGNLLLNADDTLTLYRRNLVTPPSPVTSAHLTFTAQKVA